MGELDLLAAEGLPVAAAPSPDRRSISRLTLKTARLLGDPVRIEWALEGGRWYLLSAASQ